MEHSNVKYVESNTPWCYTNDLYVKYIIDESVSKEGDTLFEVLCIESPFSTLTTYVSSSNTINLTNKT